VRVIATALAVVVVLVVAAVLATVAVAAALAVHVVVVVRRNAGGGVGGVKGSHESGAAPVVRLALAVALEGARGRVQLQHILACKSVKIWSN